MNLVWYLLTFISTFLFLYGHYGSTHTTRWQHIENRSTWNMNRIGFKYTMTTQFQVCMFFCATNERKIKVSSSAFAIAGKLKWICGCRYSIPVFYSDLCRVLHSFQFRPLSNPCHSASFFSLSLNPFLCHNLLFIPFAVFFICLNWIRRWDLFSCFKQIWF